ncbi:MAG: redoxin domain-containing protein [Elusimicrobiota bacterium]
MKLSTLLILILLGAAAYRYRSHIPGFPLPDISYADVQGQTRSLSRPDKPAVVGFWIADCGYCENMMGALQAVRQKYPEDKLDVVGLYLNEASEADIAAAAQREGYAVTLAPAQKTQQLIEALQSRFSIRGPGRDIYIVRRDGFFQRVATVDQEDDFRESSVVVPEVEAYIQKAL